MLPWCRSGKSRFIFPLALILLVRTIFALLIYFQLWAGGTFRMPSGFMEVVKPENTPTFLYLFSNWDTGLYLAIAQSWYDGSLSTLWAYLPLYPVAVRVLASSGIHPLLAAWIISFTSGMACVLVFQMVAETYFSTRQAVNATLLYFLFPPVLLFSGVAYSESLFLLFCLLAWYSHLHGRGLQANLLAALASLTRSYGILMILPIAYTYIRKRQIRNLTYVAIPILLLGGWLLYGFSLTGHFLAPLDARSEFWKNSRAGIVWSGLSNLIHGDLSALNVLKPYSLLLAAGLAFMIILLILSYKALRIDRALGLYAFISVFAIGVLGFRTSAGSFARYFSFIFPIGLALHTRRCWLLATALVIFLILDYLTWLGFLIDNFG